jgi:hypothetical protein
LIVNGDFEAGNTSFDSDYAYHEPGTMTLDGAARYGVGTSPRNYGNADWADFGDHTSGSGNMLIANGATDDRAVWRQGDISVMPGGRYQISYYLASFGGYPDGSTAAASIIECCIDGQVVGTTVAPPVIAEWIGVSHNWNSGESTTVLIELRDTKKAFVGNDFCIDDIVLASIDDDDG